MSIRFYCGIAEKTWNYHPIQCGDYACVSPVKGSTSRTHMKNSVYVPEGTRIIQDSGAFSDSHAHRLSYELALERQIKHAEQYKYEDKITHRASYDILIDEVWTDGNRSKRRWAVADAEEAVIKTVEAARFLSDNRHGKGLVLSAQGVDAEQYLRCANQVVDYLNPETDIFGLGGWCIIGKMRKIMMPVFVDTLRTTIPMLGTRGIKKAHIWGVVYPKALGALLWVCDQQGIEVSTDSVGASVKPCFGDWGYGDWRDNSYRRAPVETRGLDRARHTKLTIDWLANFRETQYYKNPFSSEGVV